VASYITLTNGCVKRGNLQATFVIDFDQLLAAGSRVSDVKLVGEKENNESMAEEREKKKVQHGPPCYTDEFVLQQPPIHPSIHPSIHPYTTRSVCLSSYLIPMFQKGWSLTFILLQWRKRQMNGFKSFGFVLGKAWSIIKTPPKLASKQRSLGLNF
jgi:hypothetical protein